MMGRTATNYLGEPEQWSTGIEARLAPALPKASVAHRTSLNHDTFRTCVNAFAPLRQAPKFTFQEWCLAMLVQF